MTCKIWLLSAAAMAAGASAASAAPTFYTGDTGRTQFATATTGGTVAVEGFEGIATPTSNGIGNVPANPFIRNGLSITGSYGGMVVEDNSYLNGGNQVRNRFGSAAGAILDDNYGDLTFTFAAPVNAFGLDLATFARGFSGASNGAFVLTVGGNSYTYNYSGSSGFGFLGITTDTSFSSLTITTSKAFDSALNDVRFGTVAAATPAVPEPATWAMMLLGFGVLGHAMRRRANVNTRIRFA